MEIELCVFGVRGSAPISGHDYLHYGGNTASFTIRTPSKSLIFLDAGTGLRVAERELEKKAKKVYLVVSHTHADHIQGFGMTNLPYLSQLDDYKDKKLQIIGPKGICNSLSRFYDGEYIWPVPFTDDNSVIPRMFGIDYSSIIEFENDSQTIRIDDSTEITLIKGNHPVKGGVILYKIKMLKDNGQTVTIIYATDNEFDYLGNQEKNPNSEQFKNKYVDFIKNADLLIADAQYSKYDYENNFQGYGHSYHEQVIDLANKAEVKSVILTHHHLYTDKYLDEVNDRIIEYLNIKNINIQIDLAKEGKRLNF